MKIYLHSEPFAEWNDFKKRVNKALHRELPAGKIRVYLTIDNIREYWIDFLGTATVENEDAIIHYNLSGNYDRVFEEVKVNTWVSWKQLHI